MAGQLQLLASSLLRINVKKADGRLNEQMDQPSTTLESSQSDCGQTMSQTLYSPPGTARTSATLSTGIEEALRRPGTTNGSVGRCGSRQELRKRPKTSDADLRQRPNTSHSLLSYSGSYTGSYSGSDGSLLSQQPLHEKIDRLKHSYLVRPPAKQTKRRGRRPFNAAHYAEAFANQPLVTEDHPNYSQEMRRAGFSVRQSQILAQSDVPVNRDSIGSVPASEDWVAEGSSFVRRMWFMSIAPQVAARSIQRLFRKAKKRKEKEKRRRQVIEDCKHGISWDAATKKVQRFVRKKNRARRKSQANDGGDTVAVVAKDQVACEVESANTAASAEDPMAIGAEGIAAKEDVKLESKAKVRDRKESKESVRRQSAPREAMQQERAAQVIQRRFRKNQTNKAKIEKASRSRPGSARPPRVDREPMSSLRKNQSKPKKEDKSEPLIPILKPMEFEMTWKKTQTPRTVAAKYAHGAQGFSSRQSFGSCNSVSSLEGKKSPEGPILEVPEAGSGAAQVASPQRNSPSPGAGASPQQASSQEDVPRSGNNASPEHGKQSPVQTVQGDSMEQPARPAQPLPPLPPANPPASRPPRRLSSGRNSKLASSCNATEPARATHEAATGNRWSSDVHTAALWCRHRLYDPRRLQQVACDEERGVDQVGRDSTTIAGNADSSATAASTGLAEPTEQRSAQAEPDVAGAVEPETTEADSEQFSRQTDGHSVLRYVNFCMQRALHNVAEAPRCQGPVVDADKPHRAYLRFCLERAALQSEFGAKANTPEADEDKTHRAYLRFCLERAALQSEVGAKENSSVADAAGSEDKPHRAYLRYCLERAALKSECGAEVNSPTPDAAGSEGERSAMDTAVSEDKPHRAYLRFCLERAALQSESGGQRLCRTDAGIAPHVGYIAFCLRRAILQHEDAVN
eukprot:gnl/TRDRNA2_/TRDRNA2_165215_c2_seq2.p1 gnl/TRDRNA2_/TRDRNA2_165215_c2~~gnl/TRDRNA2_/TRDRNA2_165215_c2_seq2.p1  ORF type:complete len:976 (-),score=160.24 gnl/TRDRNA2_/TRDRNA2_165215_c2_seq2:44-2782(-)